MSNKFEPLLIGLAMITMGSTLTALLRPQINIWQTLRTWLAGIVAGLLVMLYCYKNDCSGKIVDIITVAVATFITAIYPLAETFVKWYLVKKAEDRTGVKIPPQSVNGESQPKNLK